MLIGKSYHLLDSQRRVTIPKGLRGELGENPILTRGFDGGLFLVPEPFWHALLKNLDNQPFTKKRARDFWRLLSNDASRVEPDRLGRITVTEPLSALAQLKKEVVVVGSLQYVEIWDRDLYHHYLDSLSGQAEEIAESLDWGEQHAH